MDGEKMETKKCSKCGEVKPVGEFWKNKRERDGLSHYCINCMNIAKQKYKKKIYPCLICGKLLSFENSICTKCQPKKRKPKYTEIKCDWCGKIKNEKCFSRGSKSNYGNGKKIYCIDCTEKYYKQIRKNMWADKSKRDFSNKHFALKNGDYEEFKKYLLISNFKQHKYMIEIDKESYELALKLKKEAAINKDKKQNERKKRLRLTDYEYNERQKNISRERYNSKYIRITLEDGVRRCINVEKCSEEMKDAVQGLIDLRKKNNFIKETKNVKIKG